MMLWNGWLVGGALVVASYPMLPAGPPRDVAYVVVGLASVAAVVVGARRNTSTGRLPWHLFAAGLFSWTIGDAIYSWNADVRHVVPFPSSADAFYLGAYPLLACGIGVLIRRRGARQAVAGRIDSAIVVVGIGLMSWTWIAQPMIAAVDVPAFERGLSVAYPFGDIILLAMLVRLMSAPGISSTAFRLLVGAVTMQIVADTALASVPSTTWDYASGLDLLWLASYILWGASALHPRMEALSQRGPYASARFTRRRLATLSVVALVPSLAHLAAIGMGWSVNLWSLAGGSIAMTGLVLARTACAVSEIQVATKHRDRLQEHLFDRASVDALTGLFNRAYMIRLVSQALRRGQAAGSSTGLVVVDISGIAAVNRDGGYRAVDAVLIETARRIRAAGADCAIGRLGDNQFVVLVDGADAEHRTMRMAEELVVALREPHNHRGRSIHVAASVGVSVSLDADADAERLLNEALLAIRGSAASGGGGIAVFDDFMRREHAVRQEIESSLRRALDCHELELYYQPVVAAMSGVIDGYEALVRWNDAGEIRMPSTFIPIAEESDLICDLDRWVLREATRQFAAWLAADPERFGDLTVAVNISGRHLAGPGVTDDVRAALAASGLPSHHLSLEVTETVLFETPHAVLQLSSLRSMGVTISLDDFGTGFTSVGQLRSLPVDTIKIDRSYFDSAEPGAPELIALMTGAAHACGLLVVAEGIERPDQLVSLLSLDCDAAQGFLFSPPMPAEAVVAYRGHDAGPHLHLIRDELPPV